MKPNFALTFSSEGLRLLQRAPSGWLLVGDVAFDAADLTAEVAALRAAAGRIDPNPLRTKLVIPNEQIKFLTVASTAKTEAEAEDDAAHALRGATPYALSELRFDWAMDDGQLFIAAVARETLAEAENFAQEHGFNPVSFVALPEQATFAGEPFFGVTKSAKTVLDTTDSVMRDLQPIHVIGMADIPPEPEPEPAPEPSPEPAPEPTPVPETPPETEPAATAAPDVLPLDQPLAAPEAPQDNGPAQDDTLDQEIDAAAEPISFASVRAPRETPPATGAPLSADKPTLDTVADPKVRLDAPTDAPKRKLTLLPPEPKDSAAPAPTPTAAAPAAKPAPPTPKPAASTAAPTAAKAMEASATLAKTARKKWSGLRKKQGQPPAKPAIEIGGKPKHLGLILTAILLIFLAVMAATASFFSPDGLAGLFGGTSQTRVAQAPVPEGATQEELAEAEDVEAAGNVTEGEDAVAATAPVLLPDTPQVLDPAEAQARYITTGIWQIAPDQPPVPAARSDAEVYLASIDPTVRTVDAVALPDVGAQHDHPPTERLNPAAAGTDYDLDDRGLVKATPEGALTPDGITVFLGRPALVPPQTPTRFASAPDAPSLPKLRPRPRPETLQEDTEREQLGGRTRTELANLRPRLRPQTDKEVAEQDETPTAQAVALSLKPRNRPSGFSKIVQNTKLAEPSAGSTRTAAAAPVLPSSASVARQATVKNALNLRKVNLIGVYGKSSDRRALVRLSSGRYKKVKVGDRIDGGKVATISETELRYVKNGRNVVLKMPRG